MSEVKDDSAVDCNGDGSPARRSSTTTVPLLNTVLSYTTYGMSCATPDNLRHVMCSHFNIDELCDAKDFLWSHCNLADVPKRTNSNKRSALEATVGDIMSAMYKLDQEEKLPDFFVAPSGIGRLPRFNPESLNNIALDQRVHELTEQCEGLQCQVDNYRSRTLQYNDKLDHVMTVLQQHTNALREFRERPPQQCNRAHAASQPPWKDLPPLTSFNSTSGMTFNDLKVPTSLASTLSATSLQNTSKKCSPHTPSHDRMTSSPPDGASSATGDTHLKTSGSMTGGTVTSSSPRCSTSIHNTQQRGPSESEQQHSPTPKSGLANHPPRMNVNIRNCEMSPNEDERQFCLFSGQKDHVKSNVDFSNMQLDKSLDSDKNFHIPRDHQHRHRKKEHQRQKVIRGAADVIGSHIRGGPEYKKCDIFVCRVDQRASVADLKKHLQSRGFDPSVMRIDITSDKDAYYKSFRIIAPHHLEEHLLSSDVWPVGIWVKEFDPKYKRPKRNSRWR